MQNKIDLYSRSFFDYTPPKKKGIVITNPPFGEKLKKDQLDAFYKQMGDCFKQRYTGYDVWLISNSIDALKSIGLRSSESITLYNGTTECKFQKYSMYQGTPKPKTKKPRD